MNNTLIIKTAAAGDVVRTTSLLNVLEGNIYWVSSPANKFLLPDNFPGLNVLTIEEAHAQLAKMEFDLVISLEEEESCARLASDMKSKKLTGVFFHHNRIQYTDDSRYWFDMSRISRLGIHEANKLKADNFLTYQDCIFKMIGHRFHGEPYSIWSPEQEQSLATVIGIEKRSGDKWPDKRWWGYDKLIRQLQSNGYVVKVFSQKEQLRDYLCEIAACTHIISGDTLAMHLGMAYGKKCTAIFNCTSPQEIYDYGLLKKVVSPLLKKYFYSNSTDREVIESVSVEEVYRTLAI
jgi:heptosyltransferase-2